MRALCKENAVIFILCQNEDIDELVNTISNFETIFNKRYGYPYLFLNNKDFTADFIRRINEKISTTATFGKLEPYEWDVPSWIDVNRMNASLGLLEQNGIIHGGSLSYRQMCRFFSGFFYRNKYMQKYDFYWRIEPHVKFHCNLYYDPFEYMRKSDKDYGFTMNLYEFMDTIPSLWKTTMEFVQKYKNYISNQKVLEELVDPQGNFTGCHFWSNFEIANLRFYRSYIYQKYFEYLDASGGFFYERWGDAPIHSLAAGIFLGKKRIHFFDDIGYEHTGMMHCPSDPSMQVNCNCDPNLSLDNTPYSCIRKFIKEDL